MPLKRLLWAEVIREWYGARHPAAPTLLSHLRGSTPATPPRARVYLHSLALPVLAVLPVCSAPAPLQLKCSCTVR